MRLRGILLTLLNVTAYGSSVLPALPPTQRARTVENKKARCAREWASARNGPLETLQRETLLNQPSACTDQIGSVFNDASDTSGSNRNRTAIRTRTASPQTADGTRNVSLRRLVFVSFATVCARCAQEDRRTRKDRCAPNRLVVGELRTCGGINLTAIHRRIPTDGRRTCPSRNRSARVLASRAAPPLSKRRFVARLPRRAVLARDRAVSAAVRDLRAAEHRRPRRAAISHEEVHGSDHPTTSVANEPGGTFLNRLRRGAGRGSG